MDKKIVCFIDIIAFKSLVEKADKDTEFKNKIIEIFKILKWELDVDNCRTNSYFKNYGVDHSIKYRKTFQFSDSVVITASLSELSSLFHLVNQLFFLQIQLIEYDVFLRGSITIGNVSDDEFIFGLGLNKAYYLESKKAKNPRIIIEKSILGEYIKVANLYNEPEYEIESIKDFLIKDKKYYYINYFSPDPDLFDEKEYGYCCYVDKLREAIDALRENATKKKDLKKVDWLEGKYNKYSLPLRDAVIEILNN